MGERWRAAAVLRGFAPMSAAFDEMNGIDGLTRPAYQELAGWLGQVPRDILQQRRREAELLFRRIGITFAVYGEAESTERLIPFDVVPRILAAKEWETVKRGLEQRTRAINLYINDIYSKREVLRAGIVPEDLIFQNPVFRPEMNGQRVPHDIYVFIAGIDIVRVDADAFTCSRTMRARPPASPTCWKTARSCCGSSRTCSHAIVSRRSRTIQTNCSRR